jgi:hypothetical protein
MDAAAAGPRDLAHGARLQPRRRRSVGRLRPAAALALLILGGCGGREDYLARLLEERWEGAPCRAEELVEGLTRYVEGDHPIYPTDDRHLVALHVFLFREAPDPRPLLPLFAPHGKQDVDDAVLRRDAVASTVATSFMRRVVERPDDPYRAELYDALALVLARFAFDPAYGDAHTETSIDAGDFFGDPNVPPCAESRDAFRNRLPELLAAWRARVTRKGTSTFFGVVLRHLGAEGGEALVPERGGMDAEERKDLLLRLKDEEEIRQGARLALVEGLLDTSFDVREAAWRGLSKQGAPVDGIDPSARDADIERASAALREWARKTNP